jgi:lysophospholipase L1-like esterase
MKHSGIIIVALCAILGLIPAAFAQNRNYVFTDELVQLELPNATNYTLRVISRNGISDPVAGVLDDGRLTLKPQQEGIHIVEPNAGEEVRFLAMDPPAPIDADALLRTLPKNGKRLLAGETFRLLSMGDSVTATGDYENMLRMMLARATGNGNIEVVDRSYPGRSVDASLRNFNKDAVGTKPHAVMIMYGLNDQGANCSLRGYLEQFEWLVKQLRQEIGADLIVLLPTPDISLGRDETEHGPQVLRTVGYGTWLKKTMLEMNVPVVDTFNALWDGGSVSLDAAAKAMQPLFPIHYSKPFSTMLEKDGGGDGIHPNALGHLAMAKAVYAQLTGRDSNPDVVFEAQSFWTEEGLQAVVTAEHSGRGRVAVYPVPGDNITVSGALDYQNKIRFHVNWPEINEPEDFLKFPADHYFMSREPVIVVIDYAESGSRVHGVRCPAVLSAFFEPGRYVVDGQTVAVALHEGGERKNVMVTIPQHSKVGRKALLSKYSQDGQTVWATAECVYVRYGAAQKGEVEVDGNLEEWNRHYWFPVGERQCRQDGHAAMLTIASQLTNAIRNGR